MMSARPTLPARVQIVEVGPRDGLQNEPGEVRTEDKIAFVERLAAAGHTRVEATAFVSPKWVPQMADAERVMRGLTKRPGTRYSALVPNVVGLERALAAGVDEVAVFGAASETFSRRNLNAGIDETFEGFARVFTAARAARMPVRAYLSTSFGCPFEGAVPVARVAELCARLVDMGAYEVAVSDTIGVAHPGQIPGVLEAVLARLVVGQVALHFHDTRGTALANVLCSLEHGIATFDASGGGLGGCPFAAGATGNLATEDLIYMLDGMGIATGVSLDGVAEASTFIGGCLGRQPPSRFLAAWGARR
ncbi:MAG: hydroxymethylglutaryl-CoA lyase [Vicinamibacterales bacterium]